MLHTHTLVVSLFLILYLIKTGLLLLGKNELFDRFTKKTRIAEMVVSTLFLLTGIYLATQAPSISAGMWFWVKVAAVAVSIPLAVLGFKRKNKVLALLSFVLLVYSYGVAETKECADEHGRLLPSTRSRRRDLTPRAGILPTKTMQLRLMARPFTSTTVCAATKRRKARHSGC